MGDRFVLRHAGRRVVELADVLRHERFVAAGHADGVLVVAADGDDRRAGGGEPDGARCVAARAANELERAASSAALRLRAEHAVVAADDDIAIVHDEGVGNAFEPGDRLAVAGDQRLAGRIGAGHHQREGLLRVEPGAARRTPGRLVEEQVLQRRVRQHRAQPGESRRDAAQRVIGRRALAQQHDRPLRRRELRAFGRAHFRPGRHRRGIGDHDRERLLLPVLALAQPRDGVLVARVAGEVKAPQTLDRHDLAARKPAYRRGHRIDAVCLSPRGIEQREPRTADGARVGFRMEAPVNRGAVFGKTLRALREGRHAGERAVVRKAAGDRVARSAVGAVDECVAIPAVGRIEQLAEAVVAHGAVGADRRAREAAAAVEDRKAVGTGHRGTRADVDAVDARQRRRFVAHAPREELDHRRVPLHFDGDAAGIVAHPARERHFRREPVDERAKAHTLHDAAHLDALAHRRTGEGDRSVHSVNRP